MALSKLLTNNLYARILSAVFLIPFLIPAIIYKNYLYGLIVVLAILMAFEWQYITAKTNKILWKLFGVIYIGLPWIILIVSTQENLSIYWSEYIIFLLSIVWSTDIGAYFAGKIIVGPKLCPKISPGKTWAGFFGGVTSGTICGYYAFNPVLAQNEINYKTIIFIILLVIASIVGDLFESYIKRIFNVKDSGNIIPGHGGVLDRLDSLLFVIIFYPIFNYLLNIF